MLIGVSLLLLSQLTGELLARYARIPLPGPVLGMAILATILAVRGRIPDGLAATAGGLLKAMPLFFIPAGVGVLTLSDTFRTAWLPILIALVGSTAIAMAVTALTMKFVLRWRTGKRRP